MNFRIVLPLLVTCSYFVLAVHAHSQGDVPRQVEIESTLSARMSSADTSVTLSNCVVRVAKSYPTQCFPGLDVGVISKHLTIDLQEYDFLVRPSLTDSALAVLEFKPINSTIAAAVEATAREESRATIASETLPPIERHKLISNTVTDLLERHGIKSRVTIKSCVAESIGAPFWPDLHFDVSQAVAIEVEHEFKAYLAWFCGDAI